LPGITVRCEEKELSSEFMQLFLEELNVKSASWQQVSDLKEPAVDLDTTTTPELKAEGEARELVRMIQDLRKENGCSVKDRIVIHIPSWPKEFEEYIKKETMAEKIEKGTNLVIEII
jgi:isoleucyl-tRNA synthetase